MLIYVLVFYWYKKTQSRLFIWVFFWGFIIQNIQIICGCYTNNMWVLYK